jgi:3-mercaptopyruvate sulfurtransferase SseA
VALLLKAAGITSIKALIGGYEEWVERGEPIEKGEVARDQRPGATK